MFFVLLSITSSSNEKCPYVYNIMAILVDPHITVKLLEPDTASLVIFYGKKEINIVVK